MDGAADEPGEEADVADGARAVWLTQGDGVRDKCIGLGVCVKLADLGDLEPLMKLLHNRRPVTHKVFMEARSVNQKKRLRRDSGSVSPHRSPMPNARRTWCSRSGGDGGMRTR